MKKYLIFLTVLISFSGYSQKYVDELNEGNYLDYSSNTLCVSFQSYKVEGKFISEIGKDFGRYLLVQDKINKDLCLVIRPYGTSSFYGLEILKGSFEDVLNEFKKGRGHKKVELLFSNISSTSKMNEFSFISETSMEMKKERLKRLEEIRLLKLKIEEQEKGIEESKKIVEQNFQSEIVKSGLIGTYKIKILRHSNYDYQSFNIFGKIIVTEIGVTVEVDIPSMKLLRSVYIMESSKPLDGNLSCKVLNGGGDILVLILNKKDNIGAISELIGKTSTITTFMLVK